MPSNIYARQNPRPQTRQDWTLEHISPTTKPGYGVPLTAKYGALLVYPSRRQAEVAKRLGTWMLDVRVVRLTTIHRKLAYAKGIDE